MKIQLSEKQILGAICSLFMVISSNNVFANESSGITKNIVPDVEPPLKLEIEVDKEQIYKTLKQDLSKEIALMEADSAQVLAKKLLESGETVYYVYLSPKLQLSIDKENVVPEIE